ncbi:class I SAM-dependent methyltransferase [Micromonospora sp. B006]|uniref:class I SAM-dependent methyltransferase n=1 Tax=Micromonospora sp. B006 TaxID=2201999 RepID=UPI0013758AA3|nr:class I SAM-dependent methyltransferase [Micromonospora sp. B006]
MRLHDPESLYRRFGALGPIGFGESYQAGEWDADDLPALLTTVAGHLRRMAPRPVLWLTRVQADRRRSPETRNTHHAAARNVRHHYDLPNELFALFLDETMTYRGDLSHTIPQRTAAGGRDAQPRRRLAITSDADLGVWERHPAVGRPAPIGSHGPPPDVALLPTVTLLSTSALAGPPEGHRGTQSVELCDYRDIRPREAGGYDAIVSAEMLEGVGYEFWPHYFTTLDRLLAPGGRVAIQTITMRHDDMLATRGKDTWIHRYIFPGGLIPSVPAIEEACRRHTGLRVQQVGSYGPHYAATLRLWRERFDRHAGEVAALGLDREFRRTWNLYLAYSEAGFAAGYLDVEHLLLDRAQ